ncbi:MAG: tetratricopeptide repeat protein [Prevotella sp.]|nr:tetratricopeptide repeat protein [Prevotella sp.]
MKILHIALTALSLASATGAAQELQQDSTLLPSAMNDRPYDVLFMRAMQARQQGQTAEPVELLKQCVALDSTRSESYFFLAQYYADQGKRDSTVACYERAAALEPDNDTYTATLAQAYLATEKYDEAATLIERMLKAHPGQMDKLRMLYNIYRYRDNNEGALSALQRMEDIDGKNEQLAYQKSELLTHLGRHEEAIAEMRSLADAHPADLNYRGFYADILMMNDSTQKALDIYHDILAHDGQNANALLSLRSWYGQQGDTLLADSMTRRLLLNSTLADDQRLKLMQQEAGMTLEQHSDSSRVLALFATLLAQPDADPRQALLCAAFMDELKMPRQNIADMYRRALQLQPDLAAARFKLVQMAWDDQQADSVISYCQQARQYNPEEMAFYYYQAIAYNTQHNSTLALDALKNGISVINDKTSPDLASDFYAIMGDLLHQEGRKREAYAAYDSCLHYKPDNAGCLNNYAYFLALDNRQIDRAADMAQRAIKAEPKNHNALDTYAWILYRQQRYAEARIYVEQAMQCDSTDNWVLYDHAGDILLKLDDKPQAMKMWQQAKDHHHLSTEATREEKDKWWEEEKTLEKKLKKYKKWKKTE